MEASASEEAGSQPCLIVACGDVGHAALLSRSFRRRGWDVYLARTGPEARRLARMIQPELMIMSTELEVESGWLTCEKVTHELPQTKVYLMGDATKRKNADYALFVGAETLLHETGNILALVEGVCGRTLPAAG